MTIRQMTSYRARINRTVTVEGRTVTIDSTLGTWSSVAVDPPTEEPLPAGDFSPRDLPAYTVSWAAGYKALGLLGPGSRVELASGTLLELLAAPSELRTGRRVTGYAAQAQRVSALYQLEGELQAKGGDRIQDVTFSMWNESERPSQTGRFEDFEAEAPAEYIGVIEIDHQIEFDGRTYNVAEARPNYGRPRVQLMLRTLAHG